MDTLIPANLDVILVCPFKCEFRCIVVLLGPQSVVIREDMSFVCVRV